MPYRQQVCSAVKEHRAWGMHAFIVSCHKPDLLPKGISTSSLEVVHCKHFPATWSGYKDQTGFCILNKPSKNVPEPQAHSRLPLPRSFHHHPPCTQSTSCPLTHKLVVPTDKVGVYQNGVNILIIGDFHGCGTQVRFRILGYNSPLSYTSVYLEVWRKPVQCLSLIYSNP